MVGLDGFDVIPILFQGGNGRSRRLGAAECGHDGHTAVNRGGADLDLIRTRHLSIRSIDDHLNVPVFEQIHALDDLKEDEESESELSDIEMSTEMI